MQLEDNGVPRWDVMRSLFRDNAWYLHDSQVPWINPLIIQGARVPGLWMTSSKKFGKLHPTIWKPREVA